MRRYTSLILLAMVGATVALVWIQREGDAAPPAVSASVERPVATAGASGPSAGPGAAAAGPAAAGPAAAPRPPALGRALRTVALGCELLAPGVIASGCARIRCR